MDLTQDRRLTRECWTVKSESALANAVNGCPERAAGPCYELLVGFDFGFATGVPRPQIHELAGLAFIERAENVVFLGPSAPAP